VIDMIMVTTIADADPFPLHQCAPGRTNLQIHLPRIQNANGVPLFLFRGRISVKERSNTFVYLQTPSRPDLSSTRISFPLPHSTLTLHALHNAAAHLANRIRARITLELCAASTMSIGINLAAELLALTLVSFSLLTLPCIAKYRAPFRFFVADGDGRARARSSLRTSSWTHLLPPL
jgi:hypothetical protein